MMPPPTAANIPSFRPVRAMAGVPRQVATNSAVAIGTWLLLFSGLVWVSVVAKLSALSIDCWVGKVLCLVNFGLVGESAVDCLDNWELLAEMCEWFSRTLEEDGKLRKFTDDFLREHWCWISQVFISQILISQELSWRAFKFEQSFTDGFPLSSNWAWDLARWNETRFLKG